MTTFAPKDRAAGALALVCAASVVLATAHDAMAALGPAGPEPPGPKPTATATAPPAR